MTEKRIPYETGTEAADNLASALRDLKMAVLQYEEAGGYIEVRRSSFWNDVVIRLSDVTIEEWRAA